ncbi:hypothetical protein [Bythopirellula goksoeyrii]|uniref:Uncharacterized protein n=1 Tax=Bythopirellula goksoeyrii TaxID=1400387 RepID=A0A5B9Q8A2_9BACT|nr:hypothetical protein [Bythopirellula goksoeyrii]QEG33879.1 hypothetical protein Pr1d_11490 [Bythopirellula goksoeyrii]
MGLLVAFISLINIALGYGLAVYLRRAMEPTIGNRTVEPLPVSVPVAKPKIVSEDAPTPAVKVETASSETPVNPADSVAPISAPTPQTESAETATDSKPPVDEENVLAGIEAFRAQLAQVKDEGNAEVEEPALT